MIQRRRERCAGCERRIPAYQVQESLIPGTSRTLLCPLCLVAEIATLRQQVEALQAIVAAKEDDYPGY